MNKAITYYEIVNDSFVTNIIENTLRFIANTYYVR